ncbi:putative fungistatic metabolite [Strongylocentrotus purpuratus]|uniref:WSC domain-containing protein n=1 Tax=Strongylocentrotus purpuratus TaxID=7668 RepID=A0A7M7NPG4_STRPU|nr:putative fungistatic metabolite [Strongylocentrotus purpuratus]
MYLRLVCYYMLQAIFIWAQASSAVETYDDLYVGCFTDATIKRVLPDAQLISDDMTITVCIDYCTTLTDTDSAYAGVEHANECYCGVAGTNYDRLGVPEDGDCDFPCAGDNTNICGGINKISIYNGKFKNHQNQ